MTSKVYTHPAISVDGPKVGSFRCEFVAAMWLMGQHVDYDYVLASVYTDRVLIYARPEVFDDIREVARKLHLEYMLLPFPNRPEYEPSDAEAVPARCLSSDA